MTYLAATFVRCRKGMEGCGIIFAEVESRDGKILRPSQAGLGCRLPRVHCSRAELSYTLVVFTGTVLFAAQLEPLEIADFPVYRGGESNLCRIVRPACAGSPLLFGSL